MITATIRKNKDEIYRGFTIEGHALFANYGKDIVCAAVSTLTVNIVNSIKLFTPTEFTFDMDEGLVRLDFDEEPDEKAKLLMDSFCLGLQGIADNYKNFLKMKIKEV